MRETAALVNTQAADVKEKFSHQIVPIRHGCVTAKTFMDVYQGALTYIATANFWKADGTVPIIFTVAEVAHEQCFGVSCCLFLDDQRGAMLQRS